MNPGLSLIANPSGNVQVITVAGFLDGHTAVELDRKLSAIMKAGDKRLVLEMSGLTYIASAGVGVLINIQHQLKKSNGVLHLVNPTPSVREIFSILGLQAVFPIHDTLALGVQAASG